MERATRNPADCKRARIQISGERTRLACWRWRLASANLAQRSRPTSFSPFRSGFVAASRRHRHASRVRSPDAPDAFEVSAFNSSAKLQPENLMLESVGIIGAGVSGLTCGVLFAEAGYRTRIFAEETGPRITSGRRRRDLVSLRRRTGRGGYRLVARNLRGPAGIESRAGERGVDDRAALFFPDRRNRNSAVVHLVRRAAASRFGRPGMLHKRIRPRGSAHRHDTLSRLSRCALPAPRAVRFRPEFISKRLKTWSAIARCWSIAPASARRHSCPIPKSSRIAARS